MGVPVTVNFVLDDWIVRGLENGTFERVGGVIRDVQTKTVVTWLRESGSNSSGVKYLTEGALQLNNATSILNLSVSLIDISGI